MLDALSAFATVVQTGSFQSAARHLNLSPATLTRRIQTLEQTVGSPLLYRSNRGIELTPAGHSLYDNSADSVRHLRQQLRRFQTDGERLEGRIRLLAPVNLTQSWMQPILADFMQQHPDIRLSLWLNNSLERIADRQADLAIRVGKMPDSRLRQKRLGLIQTILVAPPAVAEQLSDATGPDALQAFPIVAALSESQLELQHRRTQQRADIRIEPTFYCNDLVTSIAMLSDLNGVMLCPATEVSEALRSGQLKRVLPDWVGESRPVYGVWNEQNLLLPPVRALLDHLAQAFSGIPVMQGEVSALRTD